MGLAASIFDIKSGTIITKVLSQDFDHLSDDALVFGEVYPELTVKNNSNILLMLSKFGDVNFTENVLVKIPNDFTFGQFNQLFLNATGEEFQGPNSNEAVNIVLTFYDYSDLSTNSRSVQIWWTVSLSLGAVIASRYFDYENNLSICTILILVAILVATIENKVLPLSVPKGENWESITGGQFFVKAK